MKVSMSLKAAAIVLAMGSFGFAGAASAEDGENADIAVGIIGQVIGGAIEAEAENEAAAEQDHRCARFARRCAEGEGWACEKQDIECND